MLLDARGVILVVQLMVVFIVYESGGEIRRMTREMI